MQQYVNSDPRNGPWVFLEGEHYWNVECGCDIFDVMLLRDGDVTSVFEPPSGMMLFAGALALGIGRAKRTGQSGFRRAAHLRVR